MKPFILSAHSHEFRDVRQSLWKITIIAAILGAVSGCITGQNGQVVSPRDLVPDVSSQSDRAFGQGPAKVGVLVPLSGPHAEIGKQLWDAAILSLFDSGRDDIVLTPHDTQGTPTGAATAAESAAADGSNIVIGPLFSSSVRAARPVLAAYGLRGIAFSNNSAEAGAPFFLIGNHPETQVDALTSYLGSVDRPRIKLFGPDTPYLHILRERLVLLDKAGKIQLVDTRLYRTSASYTDIAKDVRAITLYDKRVKALKDFTAVFSDSWAKFEDPEEALQAAFEKLAGKMEQARVRFASYAPNDVPNAPQERRSWGVTEAEYSDALSEFLQMYHRHLKVKETPQEAMGEAVSEFELRETLGKADFDAVLLPIGDRPLLVVAPMFEYFNVAQPDIWLLGTDIWESAARPIPKDLIGSRYISSSSPAWSGFQSRFQKTFSQQPAQLAAAAYDAVNVVITEQIETGRTSLDAAFLTRPQGFEGINGTFRFLSSGMNERTIQIVELRKDGPVSAFTWNPEEQIPNSPTEYPGVMDKTVPLSPAPPAASPTPPISALDSSEKGRS